MPMYFIALHNVLNVACTDCMFHPGLEVLVSSGGYLIDPNENFPCIHSVGDE
jgi:hypothetical protein